MLQLARQDERFFDKGRHSAPRSFLPDITMRRWRRGYEDCVDMLSLKEVVIVGVDVRIRELGDGGGARSRQWIRSRHDFYIWQTAKCGGVVDLRQPAESND